MGNYLDNLRDTPSASEREQERNHPLYYDWSLPRRTLFKQTPEERAAARAAVDVEASESADESELGIDDWNAIANAHSSSLGDSSSRSPSTVASSASGLTDLERARGSEGSLTTSSSSSSSLSSSPSLDDSNPNDTTKTKTLAGATATALRKIANKILPTGTGGSGSSDTTAACKVLAKPSKPSTVSPQTRTQAAPVGHSQAPKQVSLAKSAIKAVKSAKEAIQKGLKSTLTSTIDTANKKPASTAAAVSKKTNDGRRTSGGAIGRGGGTASAPTSAGQSPRAIQQRKSMPMAGYNQQHQRQQQRRQEDHQFASPRRDTAPADCDDNGLQPGQVNRSPTIGRVDSTRPQTVDVAEYGRLEEQTAIKAASNVHTAAKRAASKKSASH